MVQKNALNYTLPSGRIKRIKLETWDHFPDNGATKAGESERIGRVVKLRDEWALRGTYSCK